MHSIHKYLGYLEQIPDAPEPEATRDVPQVVFLGKSREVECKTIGEQEWIRYRLGQTGWLISMLLRGDFGDPAHRQSGPQNAPLLGTAGHLRRRPVLRTAANSRW